jgi:hypothetical protein
MRILVNPAWNVSGGILRIPGVKLMTSLIIIIGENICKWNDLEFRKFQSESGFRLESDRNRWLSVMYSRVVTFSKGGVCGG